MKASHQKLIAGGIGFVISIACCLPFVEWDQSTDSTTVPQKSSRRTISIQDSLRAEDLQQWSASEYGSDPHRLLTLASRVDRIPHNERELVLKSLMKLPEDERQPLLSILLLQWAEDDPTEPILWCNDNLRGNERLKLLKDLATTWAHRDAMGLAQWWAAKMPDADLLGSGNILGGVLCRAEPLAFATYMDQPRLRKNVTYGVIEHGAFLDPVELPRYAEALVGNTGFVVGKSHPSSFHSYPGKSVWNELFLKVAGDWHHQSPEACKTWLTRFPEEAQIVAQAYIERAAFDLGSESMKHAPTKK